MKCCPEILLLIIGGHTQTTVLAKSEVSLKSDFLATLQNVQIMCSTELQYMCHTFSCIKIPYEITKRCIAHRWSLSAMQILNLRFIITLCLNNYRKLEGAITGPEYIYYSNKQN